MQKDLESKFLSDFETNQNIAHKICRLYTTNKDAHNDLFQEITIQVVEKLFQNLEEILNLVPGCIG